MALRLKQMDLSTKTVYGSVLKITQLSAHAQNHVSIERCHKSFAPIVLGDCHLQITYYKMTTVKPACRPLAWWFQWRDSMIRCSGWRISHHKLLSWWHALRGRLRQFCFWIRITTQYRCVARSYLCTEDITSTRNHLTVTYHYDFVEIWRNDNYSLNSLLSNSQVYLQKIFNIMTWCLQKRQSTGVGEVT